MTGDDDDRCRDVSRFKCRQYVEAGMCRSSTTQSAILGEYDFSEKRLQDTVGIKPPKLAD